MTTAFAPPLPWPATFAELYSNDDSDIYDGQYSNVMATFNAEPEITAAQLYARVNTVGVKSLNAFICMAPAPGHPLSGLSLLLHTVAQFAVPLGLPSPWDRNSFAFARDVIDGEINTIIFPDNAFAPTTATIIPDTVTGTDELWAANPTAELLEPPAATAAGTVDVLTRTMMYVPPKYIPILVGRRLTPRQLMMELVGTIVNKNDNVPCNNLVLWCITTSFKAAATLPSRVLLTVPLTIPLADAEHQRHWCHILLHQLPALATTLNAAVDPATAQLVTYMGQVVEEQRLARVAADTHLAAKSARKLPSKYWKAMGA